MISAIFYLFTILLANLLVIQFGIIDLGFIMFPAGAVVIGLTFSARDFVQRRWGKWHCWWWMVVATVITAFLNPIIAFASVTAFLIAETVDWFVYTISNTTFKKRIFLSNLFGVPVDSIAFVALAFGWIWPVIIGQMIVKFASSLVVLLFIKDEEITDGFEILRGDRKPRPHQN